MRKKEWATEWERERETGRERVEIQRKTYFWLNCFMSSLPLNFILQEKRENEQRKMPFAYYAFSKSIPRPSFLEVHTDTNTRTHVLSHAPVEKKNNRTRTHRHLHTEWHARPDTTDTAAFYARAFTQHLSIAVWFAPHVYGVTCELNEHESRWQGKNAIITTCFCKDYLVWSYLYMFTQKQGVYTPH